MLPEQVRKRAERANELVAELNGQKPTGEPAPSPAPAPSEQPGEPQNLDPTSQAPAPAAPAPSPAAPAPSPEDDPNSETWKQKYLTLQGVINAEARRYQGELQARDQRLGALEQEIAALKQQAPAPAPAPATPATQFTQDEIDRYGPELLNLIASKAATLADDIVTRRMAEFAPKITEVQNQVKAVGQTVYQSKQDEFWGELAKAVPDFEAINVDHNFLVWLGQEDDITGVRRQAVMDQAVQKLDHHRVVKLFNAFKQVAGIPLPGQTQPPASAPAPAAPPVSPSPRTVGTGGSGPSPREPEAPTVKRSEIAAHYRRSSMDPTYRASPEYSAMEQRIMQAQAANRVVNA